MAEETKDSKETKEVKQEKGMPEWIAPMIAPILSALGSMGGSYMLWIKPLQERIDFLSTQVKELQTEVRELRNEQEEYEEKVAKLYGTGPNEKIRLVFKPLSEIDTFLDEIKDVKAECAWRRICSRKLQGFD